MKKLLAILAVISPLFALSQDQEAPAKLPMNEEGKVQYTEVIPMEGLTKDQLFTAARDWFMSYYKDQAEDIYYNDRYEGKMAGNFNMFMEVKMTSKMANAGVFNYDIQLFVKDGKYKYNVTNLYHESYKSRLGTAGAVENEVPECGVLNMQQRYWDDLKMQAAMAFPKIVEDLKKGMEKAKEQNPEDDW